MKIYEFLLGVLYLGLILYFFCSVFFLNQISIYQENGWLENTQVFTLVLSCGTFLFSIFNKSRGDKLILTFFALLCFSFLLREVDVEDFDIVSFVKFFGHGMGRNVMLICGFFTVFIFIALDFKYYIKLASKFIKSRGGFSVFMAGFLLVFGDFFEKNTSLPYHVFLEELFELLGYILVLITAQFLLKNKLSYIENSVESRELK